MICLPAIPVNLSHPQAIVRRVCLPDRYARALRAGHFVVMVDGKAVAISLGKVLGTRDGL